MRWPRGNPLQDQGFYKMLFDLGLTNLPSLGCYFTWTNDTVWSKLDRIMVNNQWLMQGFGGQANFLTLGWLSDHSPSLVSIFQPSKMCRR